MENQMFCYQCQETAGCSGCTRVGVCGFKTARYRCHAGFIGLCYKRNFCGNYYFKTGRSRDSASSQSHDYTEFYLLQSPMPTLAKKQLSPGFRKHFSEKDLLLSKLTNKDALPEAALWNGSVEKFDTKAAAVGVLSTENEDIRSLRELIYLRIKRAFRLLQACKCSFTG